MAIFFRVSSSFIVTLSANFSKTFIALFSDFLKPFTIIIGCIFLSINSSALPKNSLASTTTVVVPSPASLSWALDSSTIILAEGCSTSISSRIVAPSFVITTSPKLSTSILSIPFGPKVDFTASPITFAASMLDLLASLPLTLCVPSLRIITGVPDKVDIDLHLHVKIFLTNALRLFL